MTPAPDSPPAPSQARSRDKLERVVRAAEELLEEHLFDDFTVADVARRAGVAVGTVYTRFRAKDELLPALFERHDAAVGGRVAKLLARTYAQPQLSARVEGIVSFAVDYHVRHRGLLRALTQYVRSNPKSVPARAWSQRAMQYRAVAEALLGAGPRDGGGDGGGEGGGDGRGAVEGDDPLARVEFALGVVNSVCREQVLFGEVSPLRGRRSSRAALKRRLTELVLRDLTSPH